MLFSSRVSARSTGVAEREGDGVPPLVVHGTFTNAHDVTRGTRVMARENLAGTAAFDNEVNLVSKVPGSVERCGREHRPGSRCGGDALTNQLSDEVGLEPELFWISDVLPRTAAADSSSFCFRAEVAAGWRNAMR